MMYRTLAVGSTGPTILYLGQKIEVALERFHGAEWADAKTVEREIAPRDWRTVMSYYGRGEVDWDTMTRHHPDQRAEREN